MHFLVFCWFFQWDLGLGGREPTNCVTYMRFSRAWDCEFIAPTFVDDGLKRTDLGVEDILKSGRSIP